MYLFPAWCIYTELTTHHTRTRSIRDRRQIRCFCTKKLQHSNIQLFNHIQWNTMRNRLFQIAKLMHNSFILQQYACYTTILNMFRAARCSSSGGQILSPQPLVSSPSVYSRAVCRWTADCSPLSTCILHGCLQRVTIPEAVAIQLFLLMMSSVLLETRWGV